MLNIRTHKFLWLDAAVFAVLLATVLRLCDQDLEFVIEADFHYSLIQNWQKYLATGSVSALPKPGAHVYLDGQYVVYAATTLLVEWLSQASPSLASHFPNKDSYA